MKIRYLVVFAVLILSPTMLWAQTESNQFDRLIHRADSLYDIYEERQALEVYRQVLKLDPDHYEALWRTSLLYSRLGNRLDSDDQKEKYFNDARRYAEQSLEIDSMDVSSHYVMGVAMGRMALISGARERVAASRQIRKHALKALEFDSNHAGAHHLMGRWHYKIANLNFAERMAADYLFGGIPGEASNAQAINLLQKAVSLNSDQVMYHYDLARVLVDEGREKEAIEHLNRALSLETPNPDDPIYKKKARALLESL